jgi:diamine N-acetyltransferase
MYDVQKKKGNGQKASIYNFMIDWKHQDKGYGRAALSKALEEIQAIPGVNRISICYVPENPIAKSFSIIFSFVGVGWDRDGDVIAVLKL